jgi:hypothetical protein
VRNLLIQDADEQPGPRGREKSKESDELDWLQS